MAGDREPYLSCPLCTSGDMQHIVTADWSHHPLYAQVKGRLQPQMRWMQCRECAHIFTDGYFTPEAFSLLMNEANAGQVLDGNIEGYRIYAARMVEKVLPYVDSGTWLDVGCGNGALLLTAMEYGFDPVGCDLRAASVEALRPTGVEVICKDLQELELPGGCSVMSMADVLEHLPFPREGLKAAHRLLQDDGILLLSMPNCESPFWDLRNAASTNPYWGEVEHYHNFGRLRLYALLEEHGFEPLRYGVSERYHLCMEILARKT